jgi:hypothetical protein
LEFKETRGEASERRRFWRWRPMIRRDSLGVTRSFLMADSNQPKADKQPEDRKGHQPADISHPKIGEDPEQLDPADREVRPRMANPDRMSPPGGGNQSEEPKP